MHPTFLAAVVFAREREASARLGVRTRVHARLSFFRNRRRVGGAKLEDAEEGRRPVINGTRETAFLESLLVLLFAAQSERAHQARSEATLALGGAKKERISIIILSRAVEFPCKDWRRGTREDLEETEGEG